MYVADIFVPEQCHTLVVVGFLFTCLASVFVLLRVITRVWFVRSVGLDDGFIVLSNVCLHHALFFSPTNTPSLVLWDFWLL
jgi:hypothetical protein